MLCKTRSSITEKSYSLAFPFILITVAWLAGPYTRAVNAMWLIINAMWLITLELQVPWHHWLADGTTRVQSPKAQATILSCDVKDSRKYVNFALSMSPSKMIKLQFSVIFTVNMLLAKKQTKTTTKLIVRIHGQFWMAIENYVFAARWYNYISG